YYIQGNVGTTFNTNNTDTRDPQMTGGFNIGYDLGTIRTELEFLGSRNGSNGGGSIGTVDADMLNVIVYAEPFEFYDFTPFVGAGVGYARLTGSGVSNSENGLVLNMGVGMTYEMSDRFSLVAQYRYFIGDDMNVKQNNGTWDNYKSHVTTF